MTPSPLDLTEAMVRINSVAPHEGELADVIGDQIRTLGIEPVWQVVAPGRPNVHCAVRVGPANSFLTFTGHLDTVAAATGWTSDPWTPTRRDGRLYGLGALDMKSGVACALAAFGRLLADTTLHPRLGRIGFAATVDEEGLGTGARALLGTELGASTLMLLPEPFSGRSAEDPVPLAQPGKILYRILVQGRSTHALLHPEQGINAVDDAARIVAALPRLPLASHPLLGRAGCSTLKIDGGYREYAVVVPERCEVIVTRMLVPGETRDLAVAQLEELVESLGLESTVTIETPPPAYLPFVMQRTDPAVAAFQAAYARVHGRPPVLAGLMGIADNNIYVAEGGIPTIAHGPSGKGLHEADEYVEIDSLEPCVNVLVATAVEFAHQSPKPTDPLTH